MHLWTSHLVSAQRMNLSLSSTSPYCEPYVLHNACGARYILPLVYLTAVFLRVDNAMAREGDKMALIV
jgi:hypothetical protein